MKFLYLEMSITERHLFVLCRLMLAACLPSIKCLEAAYFILFCDKINYSRGDYWVPHTKGLLAGHMRVGV